MKAVPSQEEDSQTNQQLNEKSAKCVSADHTPLLALCREATQASGESGLSAGAEERSMHHVWRTNLEIERIISKGRRSHSCHQAAVSSSRPISMLDCWGQWTGRMDSSRRQLALNNLEIERQAAVALGQNLGIEDGQGLVQQEH